jgi:GGDEF domain-containing protein
MIDKCRGLFSGYYASMTSYPLERRSDHAGRKRIAEMTPDEMRRELLTSQVTRLPNQRAFEEVQCMRPAAFVAVSDADGLKAFNDRFGYEAGDELLRAKAQILREVGVDAYHIHGDEFFYRGISEAGLRRDLEAARCLLRTRLIRSFIGADFSYGIGRDIEAAETAQRRQKLEKDDTRRGEFRFQMA